MNGSYWLLAVCLIPGCLAANILKNWSCAKNVTGFPINLEAIAGVWYEAAYVPNVKVERCLKVEVPATIGADNQLQLNVSYIDTSNGQWKPTQEQVSFPWDSAQNGIFMLSYSNELMTINVHFKMMLTDNRNVAFLCGYSGISPIPMMKFMTRARELNPLLVRGIKKAADKLSIGAYIDWEDQSEETCNSAERTCQAFALQMGLIFALWQFATKIRFTM